jgi:hypothetical protein
MLRSSRRFSCEQLADDIVIHTSGHFGAIALLPKCELLSYGAVMSLPDVGQSKEIVPGGDCVPVEYQLTAEEIAEAKESLRRYFEIGWEIACRLQREGKLDDVLTKAGLNLTVKPSRVDVAPTDPPTANM